MVAKYQAAAARIASAVKVAAMIRYLVCTCPRVVGAGSRLRGPR
jgi:hypothetical protein